MKVLASFTFALVVLAFSAFKHIDNNRIIGVYGVHGDSETGPEITKLSLNEDHTFSCRDVLQEKMNLGSEE